MSAMFLGLLIGAAISAVVFAIGWACCRTVERLDRRSARPHPDDVWLAKKTVEILRRDLDVDDQK